MAENRSTSTPARREETGISRRGSTSPFGMMQRWMSEMDRMFDDFGFGSRWSGQPRSSEGTMLWAPDVDIVQRDNELLIRADLPGLSRDEVTVDVTDNLLTIQGERKREHEENREGVYRTERSYGTFYRAVPLPEGTITDQAKATFRDGVLEITMPAPPKSKGRRIPVEDARPSK